ncbi:unnamed protein product, partial [Cuscuta epithymum]
MDPKAFAKLSKQLAKDNKKKDEGPPALQHVDAFVKKDKTPGGEGQEKVGPSKEAAAADTGKDTGGSQAGELKRKNAGKGIKPPEKKKLKGDAGQKASPVVIVDESSPVKPANSIPLEDLGDGAWPLETIHFPIKK